MAQRVHIVLTDDLDQSEAAETITFALDGSTYEIDLSTENAAKLRETVQPYIAVARRSTGRAKAGTRRRVSVGGAASATEIRAWAVEQGMQVSSRGRVSADVRAAYEAAH